MRRATVKSLILSGLVLLLPLGCSDQPTDSATSPTSVAAAKGGNGKKGGLPENAASDAKINKLINALFPQPEKQSAHQLFGQIKDALDDGDVPAAQDLMFDLLDLMLSTELNEPSDMTKAEAQARLTDLLFDFVGLLLPAVQADAIADIQNGTVDGVVAVIHGDEDNVVVTPGTSMPSGGTGNTGLLVPDGALPDDEDYLLVVHEVTTPCTSTPFEELPLCYEYETSPSPAVFLSDPADPAGDDEVLVAVCVAQDPGDPELVQDHDGLGQQGATTLPERDHSPITGFRCDPRGVGATAAGPSGALMRLADALFQPVTHLFDPPRLAAINTEGMAGSIGSIDTRYVGVLPKKLEEVSGDGQTGAPGSTLQAPFVVRVVNAHTGDVVSGVDVTFSVTAGGGSLSATSALTTTTVTTDANGEASATLTLGTSAGTNTVEVSAPGTNLTGDPGDPAGSLTFTAQASGGVVINGVLGQGEWSGATTYNFSVNLPEGGTAPATLYVMNDQTNLYFALEFDRSSADPGNSFNVEFDKGGQGFTDVFVVNPDLSPAFSDNYRTQSGAPTDVSDGGTNDGVAAFLNDGTHSTYEASHPFDSSDDTHDLNLAVGDQVGIQVFVRMIEAGANYPSGYGDTTWPGPGQFQQITINP